MTRTQGLARQYPILSAAGWALALLLAVPSHAQSITVRGAWQTDPGFPAGPNRLDGWLQKDFSLQITWPAGSPASSNTGSYPADVDGYSKAWVWQDAASIQLKVDGVASHALTSPLTYLRLVNDFSYDGSQGLLSAGTYDVFDLSGMSIGCPPSPQVPYWGSCVVKAGYPDRYSYSILLIGHRDTFSNGSDLPSFQQVAHANWLAVVAAVNFSIDGGIEAGAVESRKVLTPLDLQTLQFAQAVPEPSTHALLLMGLALTCAVARRISAGQASSRGRHRQDEGTRFCGPETVDGMNNNGSL